MLSAFLVVLTIHVNSYNNNALPRLWGKGATYSAIMGDVGNGEYGHVAVEATNTGGHATEYWSSDKLTPGKDYKIKESFSSGSLQMWINGKAQDVRVIFPWSGIWNDQAGKAFTVGRSATRTDRNFDGTITINRVRPYVFGQPRQ